MRPDALAPRPPVQGAAYGPQAGSTPGSTAPALLEPVIEAMRFIYASRDPYRLAPQHQLGIPRSLTRPAHPPRTPHNPSHQDVQHPGSTTRNPLRTHQTRTRSHHRRDPRLLTCHDRTPRHRLTLCLCLCPVRRSNQNLATRHTMPRTSIRSNWQYCLWGNLLSLGRDKVPVG